MSGRLDVVISPREIETLARLDLSDTVCVVFDVLRATTSIITALANGATAVRAVKTIEEAVEWKQRDQSILLAGERNGLRITGTAHGGIDFDFGNSPREFTRERVLGRRITTTTTNGTLALHACASAKRCIGAAFVNLSSVAASLRGAHPSNVLLVCSGTFNEVAYEDVVCAGAVCDILSGLFDASAVSDAALLCMEIFARESRDVFAALAKSRNGRKLLSQSELREDVVFCARHDAFSIVPQMGRDGWLRGSCG